MNLMFNSAEYLRVKIKEYLMKIQMDAVQVTSLDGFYIVHSKGIYFWKYNSASNMFQGTNVTTDDERQEHWKGVMNLEGIYIVGGFFDYNVKRYDMNQITADPKIQLLNQYSELTLVYSCFKQGYDSAICLTNYNKVIKIDFATGARKSFYSATTEERFRSGIETKDKLLALTTYKGKLILLDGEGNFISSKEYSAASSAYEIAEVRGNRLLTADETYGCYLHNIDDPKNIIPTQLLFVATNVYRTVIKLGNKEGDFAIGGRINNEGGFVHIYNLRVGESLTAVKEQSKENIGGGSCIINVVREIKSRIIVFGGESCNVICLWYYAAKPAQEPLCWDHLVSGKINDIVPLPVIPD